MTDIVLNCPYCQTNLRGYSVPKEQNFYCANVSCHTPNFFDFNLSPFNLSPIVINTKNKEIFYYRFIFKNKFILEGTQEYDATVLKCFSETAHEFVVVAKINYFQLPLYSDWLQVLEPIFHKLELYSSLI